MRKIIITYLPASLLLAFLAMVLLTCGGGGGGGSSTPAADLTGLSMNGPSSMSEYGSATYTATASWSDNSTSTVAPTWSVNSQTATISPGGVLYCPTIASDQTVTVTATYSSGGITETATMDVTVTNVATIPFTVQMLSGGIFFEESFPPGGGYASSLSLLNADFSFEQYSFETPPDTSEYVTGTWSIDSSGNLIVDFSGQETVTVMLVTDLFTGLEVLVDDGTGTPFTAILERSGPGPYPFDDTLLPGTYVNQFGDIWIFNANGTGSTTGDGGWTYTWSVDSGILKVVFPNGYVGSMYLRPGSQVSPTSYTIIDWAFVLNTPTGDFYFYYGGMGLTRQ